MKKHKRLYKTGTKWCVWRWTDVDNEFITRLHLIKTPWFAICLHWIRKPDPEPYLHDHPVSFLSIILRGWYEEYRLKSGFSRPYLRRWWNWIRATPDDCHSIDRCAPHTLTLCFMGPKTRKWGYHTPDGWVYWRNYNRAKYGSGVDKSVRNA